MTDADAKLFTAADLEREMRAVGFTGDTSPNDPEGGKGKKKDNLEVVINKLKLTRRVHVVVKALMGTKKDRDNVLKTYVNCKKKPQVANKNNGQVRVKPIKKMMPISPMPPPMVITEDNAQNSINPKKGSVVIPPKPGSKDDKEEVEDRIVIVKTTASGIKVTALNQGCHITQSPARYYVSPDFEASADEGTKGAKGDAYDLEDDPLKSQTSVTENVKPKTTNQEDAMKEAKSSLNRKRGTSRRGRRKGHRH